MKLLRGFLALGLIVAAPAASRAEFLRLRMEWGGGPEARWTGEVRLEKGKLVAVTPLGIDADAVGSLWLDNGRAILRQPAARGYDCADLAIEAETTDALLVTLSAHQNSTPSVDPIRIPLSEILNGFKKCDLDAAGNRLFVRRAPGDRLPLIFDRPSLVFSPGESFAVEALLRAPDVPADAKVKVQATVCESRGGTNCWGAEKHVRTDRTASVAFQVPMPKREGVYEIAISVVHTGLQHAMRSPFRGRAVIAERKVQVVVLDTKPSPANDPSDSKPAELKTLVEIDPTSPGWWDRIAKAAPFLQTSPWNRIASGPLGSGDSRVVPMPAGPCVELKPGRTRGEPSWEAYWLPVAKPGTPHVLEVEYPAHLPQALGISVLEPNEAGSLVSLGLDSGVESATPIGAPTPTADGKLLRHRLIFWPRTKLPLVLLSNRAECVPAVYSKIRLLGGWNRLPRAFEANDPPSGRLWAAGRIWAAYFDRPLFAKNFSAPEALDAWSGRSLEDWNTFYRGGERLMDYLHHVGSNGLMMSVAADGSSICPLNSLQPTPRYDTGVYFDTAQDPIRKDVLELLMRLCDRERIQMIPALEFASPLPRLEAMRRAGGASWQGIEWIGPNGAAWRQTHPTPSGAGAWYNTLDPRVQEAMLEVVRELAGRYGKHASFAGLSIQLSAEGYAQLPGPNWGLDDATIERFERDRKMALPNGGADRFARRAEFLAREPARRAWLEWRADELGRFYRRIQAEVAAVRPGTKLFVCGPRTFAAAEWQRELRPALPGHGTLADSLLLAGIDVRQFRDDPNIALLHVERLTAAEPLDALASDLSLQQMPDVDRAFSDLAVRGGLFFHPPYRVNVASFDRKSPFRATQTDLAAQLVPSDRLNRRRFVHAMAALDPTLLFDGGWVLSMGQEDSLRDLVAAYRRLPDVRFERLVDNNGADVSQPVAVRQAVFERRSYAYLTNDAPFPTTVRMRVEGANAPPVFEELSGMRELPKPERTDQGVFWTVRLEAFDFVAVRFAEGGVRLSHARVSIDREVEAELAKQIKNLGSRTALLGSRPPLTTLPNADFESPPTADGGIAGWKPEGGADAVRLDGDRPHAGHNTLRLSSSGPPVRATSAGFAAPATGRLSVSVWLRVADPKRQPPVRVAVEGKWNGQDYYRYAPLGASAGEEAMAPLTDQWTPYVLQVNDLPLEGLSDLKVRLEVTAAGTVWADDVQVFDLAFSKRERVELSKLIALADVKLQNGQLGDCMRLLEGYWPRYLEAHVPLPAELSSAESLASRTPPADPPPADPANKPAESPSLLDRVKGLVPQPFRR